MARRTTNETVDRAACGAMLHAWAPRDAKRIKGLWECSFQCERCLTVKRMSLDSDGMMIGAPKYEYPDGYVEHGVGRVTKERKGEWRLAVVTRVSREAKS